MENFVVSARKYRPITFDSVVGQEHITITLKNAVRTKHLAQAFLFCGPRGVGKTTCARILAKTINCQNLSSETEACGKCESCKSFQNNASFNIHELDAASNNSVEDIRNLIDQVRYPPTSGKFKIYIIDEVHMLSSAAFNAFLKTLEEPPSYAIFILATTEKHKILPTILSRCQNFDFNRIKVSDMANHLNKIAEAEGVIAESEALELIAQKADGGLRDALSMFDLLVTFSADNTLKYKQAIDNLHILDYDYYFDITHSIYSGDQSKVFLIFDEILKKGFDGHIFLVGMLDHFRNLMVCKDRNTIQLIEVSASIQQKYLEQSEQISLSFLLSALSIGSACDINYKSAKNQRLHVEICLLKMANISNLFNFASLPTVELEKKNLEPNPNVTNQESKLLGQSLEQIESKGQDSSPIKSVVNQVSAPKSSILRSTNIVLPSKLAIPQNSVSNVEVLTHQKKKPFTKGDLQIKWDEFLQKLEADERYGEIVWLKRDFELQETRILLKLANELQRKMMVEDGLQDELVHFLRDSMENSEIKLTVEVAEEVEDKKMIYTQAEKFNYLAEKNPNLHILKTTLGLDYDY
ncbi:MAG: DNA polymerase III subunit gamma/tau [Bacteroidota bacterium]